MSKKAGAKKAEGKKKDTKKKKVVALDDKSFIEKKIKNIRLWGAVAEKKYDEIDTLDKEIKDAIVELVNTRCTDEKKYKDFMKKMEEWKNHEEILIYGRKKDRESSKSRYLNNCLKVIVNLEIDVSEKLFNCTNHGKSLQELLPPKPEENADNKPPPTGGSSMFSTSSSIFSNSTLRSVDDVIESVPQDKYNFTNAFERKKLVIVGKTPVSDTTNVFQGKLNGIVCIKQVSPKDIGSDEGLAFAEKIKTIKNEISHPALLSYFGVTTEPPQLVLQFAKNFSLEDYLNLKSKPNKEIKKLPFVKKMKIARVTVIALQWLYSKKYKHLRLKPSNLLLTEDFKLKVADYGWGLRPLDKPEELIKSGHAYYYAPELLDPNIPKEEKEGDESSDVYSFGLILETLLTEKIPFSETKDFKQLLTEKEKPRVLPPSTPDALKALFNECTGPKTKRPTFQKINEMEISSSESQNSSSEGSKSHKIWDKIILEVMTNGSKLAEKVWEDSKEGSEDSIHWSTFWKHFMKELFGPDFTKIDEMEKTKEGKCIKYLLLNKPADKLIPRTQFQNFLGYFPLHIQNENDPKLEGATYLRNLKQLLSKKWFHGEIKNNEAEKRLRVEAKSNLIYFLVRYSTTKSKTFVLCTYSADTFQKARIYKGYLDLIKFIDKLTDNDKKLQPCERGRKFLEIFPTPGGAKSGGYAVDDKEEKDQDKEYVMDDLLEHLGVPKEANVLNK